MCVNLVRMPLERHAGEGAAPSVANGDEVQVWHATVADSGTHLLALLDDAERERLLTYRRPVDRTRFLIGAALVRLLAGRHLGTSPASVVVRRRCPDCSRPHGRIEIPGSDVRLSVSHSGQVVAVAIHVGADIGIDIEEVPARRADQSVVARVLAPAEAAALVGLPPAARVAAFLRFWTLKEALLKMTGDGLRVPPTDLVVSSAPPSPVLVSWAGRTDLPGSVSLYDVPLGSTHLAALAVHRAEPTVVRVVAAAPLLAAAARTQRSGRDR